jgi:response regulator RpfG family c-di-GMP phosphodiesterase
MKPISSDSDGLDATMVEPIDLSPTAGQSLLEDLLSSGVVLRADWEALPGLTRDGLRACRGGNDLLEKLVEHNLLTDYQCARVKARKTFGLILGNYRVLERLGCGGMGIVYRGEHARLRRQVAIKVLAPTLETSPTILLRFDSEMQAVARLQHPNIVAAIDAGEAVCPDEEMPNLHYLVMEFVPGQNLEKYVQSVGPLPVVQACDIVYQIASALAEAHKHHLVHRDLKPSNIQRTPEGRVKLLDFGLAQHFTNRMTEPGIMLGTVEYMAPEQAKDARGVDVRADIYGLGGVLFWCLTGQPPWSRNDNTIEGLVRRQTSAPPSVRSWLPDLPPALDHVIQRMMATHPADRFPNPQAVMSALLPFLHRQMWDNVDLTRERGPGVQRLSSAEIRDPGQRTHRVLIVDDEPGVRQLSRLTLVGTHLECEEATDGLQALEEIGRLSFDLVLADLNMPGMSGLELCTALRQCPPSPNLKVIMFSGNSSGDEMAQVLSAGADDYLLKPFSTAQLRARVEAALRLKDAQDRTDQLNQHLLTVNLQLEQHLSSRQGDLILVRNVLVQALARLVLCRNLETRSHLLRVQRYARCLGEEAARTPVFASVIDENYLDTLECCVLLHDIGKVGLPEHILFNPGKLGHDERILMQTHTRIGSDLLKEVSRHQKTSALTFLQTAIEICRHHHERFDGKGYPDRLAGTRIPLSARIVAIGDVYDALRSHRVYKPALAHEMAVELILGSTGHFDPNLLKGFERCHQSFDRVFLDHPDER